MDIILKIYHFNENEFKDLLRRTFKDDNWLEVFLNDSHHGFTHGNQVRLAGLKLIEKLNPDEKEKLRQEGKNISPTDSYEYAVVAMEIAAIFHDCGRFNSEGEVVAEEQKYHHILSAQRAKIFCDKIGLNIIAPPVAGAILGHDFQSQELTPDLDSPQAMIGKIVQAADQMGWFHPDSLDRTLDFSKALERPFYDPGATREERLAWKPGFKARDALTVMLSQLFGPTEIDRFGIEFARQKVEMYKAGLEENIIKMAEKNNLKSEAEILIKEFKKRHV